MIAQVFALLAAVSAGVVGAVGLPGLQTPDPSLPPDTITPGPVDPATGDPTDRARTRHDSELISGSFAMLGNSPPERVESQPDPGAGDVLVSGTEASGETSLRYIGRIVIAGAPRAVLVFDDKQKLLSIGKTYQGTELIEVDPEYVIVKRDGSRERIDLEGVTLSRVTSSDAPVPSNTSPFTASRTPKVGKDSANPKTTAAGETIRRLKGGASAAQTSELARRQRERREAGRAAESDNK